MDDESREKLHHIILHHFTNELSELFKEPEDKIRDRKIYNIVMTESAIIEDDKFSNDYEELNYKITLANLQLHNKNKLDMQKVLNKVFEK